MYKCISCEFNTCSKNSISNICQCCKKEAKTTVVTIYYWRVNMCIECENKARRNGHIE